ncbi:MAG: hypothetical protein HDQ96_14420 [Lachnospiraceae bacterium]|nr:hypothetical protein [Lachnospiraceae bacterium]
MKQWKKITIFIIVFISAVGIVFKLYTGNDGETEEREQAISEEAVDYIEEDPADEEETPDYIEEDSADEEVETVPMIVGTWKNIPDAENEWMTSYRTCFSPDGRVVHYGGRNVDIGTWVQEGDVYTAHFDDCSYIGVDGRKYKLPSYTVTYRMWFSQDGQELILERNTDRQAEVQLKLETEQETKNYTATDSDDYRCPLYYESDLSEVYDYDEEYWPKIAECSDLIREELLKTAGILLEEEKSKTVLAALPCTIADIATFDFTGDGRDEIFVYVESINPVFSYKDEAVYIISPVDEGSYTILVENTDFKGGYTDILAPDGTELFSLNYGSYSSWHGGIRYHLGYREGQIVVDREESYWFHWTNPIINYVNDFKNGSYYVYIARNPSEEYYPWYIDIKDSIKIDEEHFEPVYLPFSGYEPRNNDYPAVYSSFHPFSESWWLDGGKYPEDGEDYYGPETANWIEEAKDDDPDEMLKEAVEQSGYQMTKVAYPWTKETKENVIEVLRCPVADYYYISDDYAAYYARGKIYFEEIKD